MAKKSKNVTKTSDLPIRDNRIETRTQKPLPLALRELADLLADRALERLNKTRTPHGSGKGVK